MSEERIQSLMKNLHCTRAEAVAVIQSDEAIDKGEQLFELSAEQKKAVRQATSTGTRKRTATTRVRKVDEDKKYLISCFRVLLEGMKSTIISIKTETELTFSYKDEVYTLKLVKHRKKDA